MGKNQPKILAAFTAVLVLVLVAGFALWPRTEPSVAKPVEASAAQECSAASSAFTPTAFTIDRVGAHERVLAMGLQNGIVPAPPMNDRRSAAWWKDGPAPGDGQGKVVLTIHTYRPSLAPALGNELYAGGKSALQPGDIIKLHGKNGEVQCYEFTEAPRIFIDEYDENSTVMLDDSGPESLVIVICWDFDKKTTDWDSRVMFQFKAVS